MRVLALTNLYPNPDQPTRATFNRQRLRILNETHPVRVIAPVAWTDELRARRKGVRIPRERECDGITVTHPRYYFPPGVLRGSYGKWFRASVAKAFRAAVSEFRPDVVYTPWAYPDGWAAKQLAKPFGLPVVLHILGSDVLLLDKYPAKKRRTAEALAKADGIISVSADLARHAIGLGADPRTTRVIYDGVDKGVFSPGPRDEARKKLGIESPDPLILFVGNLVPVKAVDVLIHACQWLGPDFAFRLAIVGQGPQRFMLEQRVTKNGLDGRVRFVGPVPHAELPTWFRAADLFVLPSHSEGVPNVLLEASACGTPWVASKVGGIPEIAHLGASRLVPPNTPEALAATIREMLTNRPPAPATAPRDVADAVAEVAAFLDKTIRRKTATPQHAPSRGI